MRRVLVPAKYTPESLRPRAPSDAHSATWRCATRRRAVVGLDASAGHADRRRAQARRSHPRPHREFDRGADAEGRKRFITAYEQRMDALVTHPLFGYRVNYRRVLEIQARLLARVVGGELSRYPGFETR